MTSQADAPGSATNSSDAADRPTITSDTGRPLAEPADQVVAPDPLDAVRPMAACLPNDADDTSDAGRPTTDHDTDERSGEGLSTP